MTRRTLVLVCASAFILLDFVATVADDREPVVESGTLSFQLHTLDGQPVAHTDSLFAGRVVFITLWGTFCPPCITEIPTFNAMQQKYSDSGLVVVGIAFERETDPETRREQIREFARKWKIEYLILDGGHLKEFSEKLPGIDQIRGFPVEVLIDRSGTVVDARHGSGYRKIWARHLEQRITRELRKDGHKPDPAVETE